MMHDEIRDRTYRDPFEPFRIKLVNGDIHDVFYPMNVALLEWGVSITPPDQNWVTFPIEKIVSIESLIADYHGQAAS